VTIDFKVLYCLVVLEHGSKKILHFNVTTSPEQAWTNLQIKQALQFDTTLKYVVHDRGSVFGPAFHNYLETLAIEGIKTEYKSPWQNAYTERIIGTTRRECLDHMIILNEKHLRKVMRL